MARLCALRNAQFHLNPRSLTSACNTNEPVLLSLSLPLSKSMHIQCGRWGSKLLALLALTRTNCQNYFIITAIGQWNLSPGL